MTAALFLVSFALMCWVVYCLHVRVPTHGWESGSLRALFVLGMSTGMWVAQIALALS